MENKFYLDICLYICPPLLYLHLDDDDIRIYIYIKWRFSKRKENRHVLCNIFYRVWVQRGGEHSDSNGWNGSKHRAQMTV